MPQPKNIVLITTDQMHYKTLGCTGSPSAKTPNLDKLAAEGMLFNNHFVANPVCSPSRASIMTGLYPSEHGLWGNGCRLASHHCTLPQAMQSHGWQTAHFGKLHLVPIINRVAPHPDFGFEVCEVAEGDQQLLHDEYFNWLRTRRPELFIEFINEAFIRGQNCGYKSILPREYHLSEWVTDRASSWLRRGRDKARPFFLNVGYFDPHHPFNPCEPFASLFDDIEIESPDFCAESLATRPAHYRRFYDITSSARDKERCQQMRRAYFAMISHVDACVGRLVDALENEGLRENTVIVFTSDHGEFMGNHGLIWKGPYMLDDLLRVPLIISGGGTPAGLRHDHLTSAVDLMPTLQALASIESPYSASGISFIEDSESSTPKKIRDYIMAEWDSPSEDETGCLRCIRTESEKLVYYPRDPSIGEFYDISNDPCEFYNDFGLARSSARVDRCLDTLSRAYLSRRPAVAFEGAW